MVLENALADPVEALLAVGSLVCEIFPVTRLEQFKIPQGPCNQGGIEAFQQSPWVGLEE